MSTIRKQIMALLNDEVMSALDLSRELRIKEKDVCGHLPHIAKSIAARRQRLLIQPSQCMKCGYTFSDRSRFTRPGRCPACKSTHISRPLFQIIPTKTGPWGSD